MKETALRILALFFSFFVIIVNVSLFAYLKTNLITERVDTITSTADLIRKKVPFVLVEKGRDLTQMFEESPVEEYKELLKIRNSDPDALIELSGITGEGISKQLKAATDQKRVFIAEANTLYSIGDFICYYMDDWTYNIAREPLKGISYVFPVTKKLTHMEKVLVKKASSRAQETGFILYIAKTVRGPTPPCYQEVPDVAVAEPEALELVGFGKTFLFWATGITASIIIFFIEIVVHKYKNKRLLLK